MRAAQLAGAEVLDAPIQDDAGNETRFVWLSTDASATPFGDAGGAYKTSIMFAGEGDETPGWRSVDVERADRAQCTVADGGGCRTWTAHRGLLEVTERRLS